MSSPSRVAPPIDAPAARMRRGRRRRRLLLLAPFVGLVLAEAALRAAGGDVVRPPSPGPYQMSLVTDYGAPITPVAGPLQLVLCPGALFRLRPGAASAAFRVNRDGFRGPELAPKRPGKRRIACLGASTMFGLELPSDADTIPARLAELLPDAETINAGVPWYLSGQELCHLAGRVLALKPDVVLLIDGWTDAFDWWRFPPPPHGDYGFNYVVLSYLDQRLGAAEAAARDPWPMFRAGAAGLWGRSAIVGAVRRRLAAPGPAALPGPAPAEATADDDAGKDRTYEAMRDRYVEHVATMRDLCLGAGVRFVAALQGEVGLKARKTAFEAGHLDAVEARAARYADGFVPRWRRFKADVRERLAARGLSTVDLGDHPLLRDAEESCYGDVVHPTAEGARRIAAVLRPLLEWIPRQNSA